MRLPAEAAVAKAKGDAMTVASILKDKGTDVCTVEAGQRVIDTAKLLADHKIGAAIVVDAAGAVKGVFSERDLLFAVSSVGQDALQRPVREFMSTKVTFCAMGDTVEHLMALMTERRIRHIPVVDDGRLVGVVSIGDVVKRRIADTELEAEAMRQYIATG